MAAPAALMPRPAFGKPNRMASFGAQCYPEKNGGAELLQLDSAQISRLWSAIRPIEKLNGVNDGNLGRLADLDDAADIAGGYEVGCNLLDIADLAVAQLTGDFRLENVIGAGRTAAEMTFRDIGDVEAGILQEGFRFGFDLLAVLHGTGRVISNAQAVRRRSGIKL